ncbi:MAG: diguanylate cyclase [Azospirillaceae bacterium]|nr:diguanylate cyclase [Azospirillaceae bacterium]
MSLRAKLVVALLLGSLLSIALVGVVAHILLMQRFDDIVMGDASRNFRGDVVSYYRTYGSFEAALRAEPFSSFVRRRRVALNVVAGREPIDIANPDPPGEPPSLSIHELARQDPEAAVALAPITPATGTTGDPNEANRSGGRPFHPPFHFLLLDADFRVVLGAGTHKPGVTIPPQDRTHLMPIRVDGARIGYASLDGVIHYSGPDIDYLKAIRQALLFGCGAATLLALGLGFLMGNRLSDPIRQLIAAAGAIEQGKLHQRVKIRSGDEVGTLAHAFNRMSDELERNHREMQVLNQTIQQQADRLKETSIRDALTQLYNRRHFDEQATTLFGQANHHDQSLAVMVGDIDFFKTINDRFSHATGDAVLRQIGEILRINTRPGDIIARYGGEEFVAAFPETAIDHAASLCERLRQAIETSPWHTIHPDLRVTISIGLDGNRTLGTLEAMLHAADQRLYRAKRSGRNRVCFT